MIQVQRQKWWDTYWVGFICGVSTLIPAALIIARNFEHLTLWSDSMGRMWCIW